MCSPKAKPRKQVGNRGRARHGRASFEALLLAGAAPVRYVRFFVDYSLRVFAYSLPVLGDSFLGFAYSFTMRCLFAPTHPPCLLIRLLLVADLIAATQQGYIIAFLTYGYVATHGSLSCPHFT